MIDHQTARPFNLNYLIILTNAFHWVRCNLPKRNFPTVRVEAGFCFCISRRMKAAKEFEDHWTSETSERKG